MNILELITSIELGIIYGIAAIGIFLTFRIIDFPDLTCDGSFVLGAATSAILLQSGYNPIIALLAAGFMGGLAGLGTGVLHIIFKMTNLLAGILMAFMLYSVNLKVMQGVPNIALINLSTIFTVNNPLLLLTFISIIMWLGISFLLSTDFGLAMRSLGQNRRLALNCGVHTAGVTIITLIFSNALIGFSGGLFCQHQGFADISQGIGTIVIGLAAVMIGEKIFRTRSILFTILSCLIGSVLYRLIVAFALHSEWLGLETQDLNLITGVLVIAIMLLPSGDSRRQYAAIK